MMAWKNISILQMCVCLCQYLDEFQYQNKCKNAFVKYVFMFIHTVVVYTPNQHIFFRACNNLLK